MVRPILFLFLAFVFAGGPAEAREPKRAVKRVAYKTGAPELLPERPVKVRRLSSSGPIPLGYGFDVGILDQANGTSALGMRLFPGARFFLDWSLSQRWSIKPSIGYFINWEGEGNVSFVSHLFELGVTARYVPIVTPTSRWLAGATVKGDMTLSALGAGSAGVGNPVTFQARVGPSIGGSWALEDGKSIVADFDLTFSMLNGVRAYGALTFGLLFR